MTVLNSSIEVQKGMALIPHACVNCGSTGQQGEDGPPESIFFGGVDINWGDSLYLCMGCAQVVAQLVGFHTPAEYDKVARQNKKLSQQVEKLTVERDNLEGRMNRMLDGARARKEAKESRDA